MIDINELDDQVLSDILKNLGLEDCEDEKVMEEKVGSLSPTQALELYLRWHGIIGYAHQIVRAYENLKAANK